MKEVVFGKGVEGDDCVFVFIFFCGEYILVVWSGKDSIVDGIGSGVNVVDELIVVIVYFIVVVVKDLVIVAGGNGEIFREIGLVLFVIILEKWCRLVK